MLTTNSFSYHNILLLNNYLKHSFFQAKVDGQHHSKWLLVNVQDVREFPCQQLNRDVWSNEAVRNIIKERFVLWQVWALYNFYVPVTTFSP